MTTGNKEKSLPSSIGKMDFCWIINDKKLKGSGLRRGDIVLVGGMAEAQASAKDPYLKRSMCIVLLVQDNKICVPSDDNSYRAYMVDPRNLAKVDEDTLKWAQKLIQNQYGSTS